jgi:hypothetical protein
MDGPGIGVQFTAAARNSSQSHIATDGLGVEPRLGLITRCSFLLEIVLFLTVSSPALGSTRG